MQKKGKIIALAALLILVAGAAVFGMIYGRRQTTAPSGSSGAVNAGRAQIHLSEDNTTASGAGISLDRKKIMINKGGVYYLDGQLTDGQIYVKVGDKETVTLSLEGVSISNKTEHPIHVENAKETILTSGSDAVNTITAGEGVSVSSDKDTQVAAVFSRDDLTVEKGNYHVTASGDGFHCNDDMVFRGGDITIRCGDDGVHANEELKVLDGRINVTESYEGLEANQITIEDGEHAITASDDGINANGGPESSGGAPGGRPGGDRPGQEEDESADEGKEDGTNKEKTSNLIITGGKLMVDAQGDGLDSNGNLIVKGGEIIVDGPSSDGDGALDTAGECRIEGGVVLAVGSSGMAETFDEDSGQRSFRYGFDSPFAEDSEISIVDETGKELYRHVNKRPAASIVFSSPELEKGKKYTIKAGDRTEEITLDKVSSSFGTEPRIMGGKGPGGGGGRPGGPRGEKPSSF